MVGKSAWRLKNDEMKLLVWRAALWRLHRGLESTVLVNDFEELYSENYDRSYVALEVDRFKKMFDEECLDFIRAKIEKLEAKVARNHKEPKSYKKLRSAAAAASKYKKDS